MASNWLADTIDNLGTAVNLPELGFSEFVSGGNKTTNTGRVGYMGPDYNGTGVAGNRKAFDSAMSQGIAGDSSGFGGLTGFAGGLAALPGAGSGPSGTTGLNGGSTSGNSASEERAYYDDQIAALDRILGGIGTQMGAGLENLGRSLANERTKLGNQKTQTLRGYEDQSLANAQDKQRGVEQVDQYANQNYNSLQRLLQGANAGSSSVARELIPYLVSKSAGTRRTNVFDTAGRNEQQIVGARKNAEDQYESAFGELEDQGRMQEQGFRQSILNQENDLLAQKQQAEMKRSMANGSGYTAARAASQGTQDAINSRQDQLNNLFSQFKPTFQQKSLSFQKPELGQYTVDRAQINTQNQGLPAESSYYQSMLRKKQQDQF